MSRTLTFNVFRHTPANPDSRPRMERYRLEESPGMTLFIALNLIRDEQDPGLAFDDAGGPRGAHEFVGRGAPGGLHALQPVLQGAGGHAPEHDAERLGDHFGRRAQGRRR